METSAHKGKRSRAPLYRWLALVPAALMLGGVPFANRLRPFVFGLPFLVAWLAGCVVLTSIVMAVIGALDRRRAGPR
jgi:hypothetical protein